MKKILILTGAMLLSMAASAQNTLTYNWGGVHAEPGQAISINLRMDKAAVVTTLNVLLTLEDKQGNILYQKWTTITNGQTVVWAAGWALVPFGGGAGQSTFDFYMESPIQVNLTQTANLVVPSIRVDVPGTAQPWVDMLTPSLEVVDTTPIFHVTSFANNPHLTIAAKRE